MLFAIYMLDKPDSVELRAQTGKSLRLTWLQMRPVCRMGGPLYADDHRTMIGSVVIKDFVDRSAAEKFISNEPFNKAGLFETVLINPFGAFVDK